MKRTISILVSFIVALIIICISCNKTEKIATISNPPLYNSDAERDANAKALVKLITADNDWKTLVQINSEFLDIVVKSNVVITSDLQTTNHPALEQLNSKEYRAKFDEAKRLARNLMNKYFQNSNPCYPCETMTEAKWQSFAEQVNTFRNNTGAYNRFLMKLGINTGNTAGKESSTSRLALPDCNNWRFSLCGGACVLTAPTVIVFAGCMAVCIAEYC